jgi:hypothetical protein
MKKKLKKALMAGAALYGASKLRVQETNLY